jgi:SanA protein
VQDLIIITQEFHLYRAVYIARKKGLNAFGAIAHKYEYTLIQNIRFRFRDKLASIKAFLEVSFNSSPHFLGEKIPITGDSKLSYD